MAAHNLMDYSLLLITESNPEYVDDGQSSQHDYRSLKSADMARLDTSPFLKRQPSGIPEVQEEEEDEEESIEVQPHPELIDNLDRSTKQTITNEISFDKVKRVKTTALRKGSVLSTSGISNRSGWDCSRGTTLNTKQAKQLIKRFQDENEGNQHRYISACGKYIYNLAIIDYLQAYDLEKHGEHLLKVWLYRRDGSLISACNPKPYARRYLHFMREHVIINMSKKEEERTSSFVESFIYDN
mmetsp:Transcript_30838/g.38141  ORF Transcript_30838/g.38141 Transcript_30838/m.38141 type:complete len:241 (+) Transcript_30838:2312-3034(+)